MARPSQARRPASAGVSPAITRSRLDLPLPLAPVSTSAPPGGERRSRAPRTPALAAAAGERAAGEAICRGRGGAGLEHEGRIAGAAIMTLLPAEEKRPRWGDNRGRFRSGRGKTAAEMGRQGRPASHLGAIKPGECDANSSESWRKQGFRSRFRGVRGAQPGFRRRARHPNGVAVGEPGRSAAVELTRVPPIE